MASNSLSFSDGEITELLETGLGTIESIERMVAAKGGPDGGIDPESQPGWRGLPTPTPRTTSTPTATGSSSATLELSPEGGATKKASRAHPTLPNPLGQEERPGNPLSTFTPVRGSSSTHDPFPGSRPGSEVYESDLMARARSELVTRWSDEEGDPVPTRVLQSTFKRGADRKGANPGEPGHRREYSIGWVCGTVRILEWCNPACSPISMEPRYYQCTCGTCPAKCPQCAGDNGIVESNRGPHDGAGNES
uniref:V protein n=1 Tax=La Piedad-Michoacan-Mexico virus TaxID=3052562 RepID=A0A1P8D8A8_LPMV|nr:V protein [Orthorubulavirus suis]APU52789.1 V protein [Orthorubulavirus suis]